MNNALVKVDSVRADIVPLPPYDAEHLEALGKKFCTRIGMPDELFEDAVQEFVLGGLVALKKKLEMIYPGACRTYQHKFGESYVRKFLEREGKYRKRTRALSSDPDHGSDSGIEDFYQDMSTVDPVDEALGTERTNLLMTAVADLTDNDRRVLTMWLDESLSYKKIGKSMGVSHHAIFGRMKRILRRLRIELLELR